MADEQGDSGWQTLLGLLLIAGLFCLGYLGVVNVVKWLTPTPPTVSLSAFFVDDAGIPAVAPDSASYGQGHIRVKGYVYQGDQPVKGGTVRITVASNSFQQSTVTSLKDGAFETEDPAFRPVRPGDAVTVTADVSFGKLSTSAGIFLNTKPPVNKLWIGLGMLAGPIVMGGVFLWAFTGKTTPGKNQTAIIFSYLVIVVVLALPIVTPVVLLRIFPEAVEAMIGEPAGLVNTHTNNQLENDTQWALNIGGYSFVPESNAPNRLATRATEKAVVEKAGANIGQENIAATSTHTTQQGSTAATESSTVAGTDQSSVSPAKTSSTDSSRQSGQGTTPVRDDSKPQTGTANAPNILTSGALKPPIVQVQGGLVIPLYVIILSVIGGAINMTRKVPFFQKEGEEASVIGPRRLPSRVGEFAMKVIRRDKVESAAPAAQSAAAGPVSTAAITSVQATPLTNGDQPKLESSAQNPAKPVNDDKISPKALLSEQAKTVEGDLDLLIIGQIKRNGDTDTTLAKIKELVNKVRDLYSQKGDDSLLGFNSYEDWFASHPKLREILRSSWRVELLNQYMYLISAPFLAMVAYYILELLGLSKQGVVVVLSFSVGLISEKILGWILGIAAGYFRNETSSKRQPIAMVKDSEFQKLLERGHPAKLLDRVAGQPIDWLLATPRRVFERPAEIKGSLDREHSAKGRVEQSFLRRKLFGDVDEAACCICGRRFPLSLLVAAHIKPRSECSRKERLDAENVVFGVCLLGCDALYERGLVAVGPKGRILVSALSSSSRSLVGLLRPLRGRACPVWRNSTKSYFDWHFTRCFMG